MKNNVGEVIGGAVGTALSATGTALQTSEVLQIISLIITIIGSLLTIVMLLLNWWKNAKKDGKIDKDEIKEGVDIIVNGMNDLKDKIEDKEEKK